MLSVLLKRKRVYDMGIIDSSIFQNFLFCWFEGQIINTNENYNRTTPIIERIYEYNTFQL